MWTVIMSCWGRDWRRRACRSAYSSHHDVRMLLHNIDGVVIMYTEKLHTAVFLPSNISSSHFVHFHHQFLHRARLVYVFSFAREHDRGDILRTAVSR